MNATDILNCTNRTWFSRSRHFLRCAIHCPVTTRTINLHAMLHHLPETLWGKDPLTRRSTGLTPFYVDRYRGPHGVPTLGRHGYWEFSFTLGGTGTLAGRECVDLAPCTAILIPPGYLHDERGPLLDTLWIGLQGRSLSRLRPFARGPAVVHSADLCQAAQRIWLLAEQRNAPIGPELDALTAALLRQFLRLHTTVRSEPHPDWVERAIRQLSEHYAMPIAMAGLARQYGCSPRHFDRVFKQRTGQAPRAYVTERRIRQAARLLENTDLPVQEIARQVGYENAFYFSRQFRRTMGCPPRQYRNQSA